MKKMQSYRLDTDTIKKIDELSELDQRSKSNVIEKAVTEYYNNLKGKNEMKYNLTEVMDLTGATSKQDFIDAFHGKTEQAIKELLVYMFPGEPIEPEFIEDIKTHVDVL